MIVKHISTDTKTTKVSHRPKNRNEYIGQTETVSIIQTAISAAQIDHTTVGHILLSGPSGYGKTTLAAIVASQMGVSLKSVAAYAISKPAELISILNHLTEGDVLFIDEIHRLHPKVEEVLYTAMEDRHIDMVMPEGGSLQIGLPHFTLIGATTQMEKLSIPFKNRFIYKFHLREYDHTEKKQIISRYLKYHNIYDISNIVGLISDHVESTPREIYNICVKIKDFITSNIGYISDRLELSDVVWSKFISYMQVDVGGLTSLHRRYIDILSSADRPLGLKTIATQLGISPESVESDIEPLLLKGGYIHKNPKGRVLMKK